MARRILVIALLLIPSVLMAAPDGAQLYTRHCAACHGSEGRGGVGVPLALPAFLSTVSDEFLFRTIRSGRPGRVMPAFTDLSDTQVGAIVAHLRSWSPSQPPLSAPEKVKGDVVHGKTLFAQHCAACHGAHGEGGHGTGVTFSRPRELPIMPPALNNPGFLKAASDSMIKQTLMKGREGTPMVSFLAQGLRERDINDIVAFVRSFETNPIAWKPPSEEESPILEAVSPYSIEETVENLKRAIVGKNFVVIRIQTLDNGFVPEAEENHHQVIVYFCNFGFINQALSLDPRIGLFMPCRVTVVEQNGVVKVMSINPKYQSRLFNNEELDRPCDEITEMYKGILEEATI